MRNKAIRRIIMTAVLAVGGLALAPSTQAASSTRAADARSVAEHWTAARMAAAIPRDIVVDANGTSMMVDARGKLVPYGIEGVVVPNGVGKPSKGGTVMANAQWNMGGMVETATGRLYFEMHDALMRDVGYVCSGSTVVDADGSISSILTAAHCVYDDVNKEFATNVLFIPALDSSGVPTAADCTASYTLGCWTPSYGVVADAWTTRVWPNNIPYDYGFYVVTNASGHAFGDGDPDLALDSLGTFSITAPNPPDLGTVVDAIGYSYKYDPKLMYCEQALGSVQGTYGSTLYTNNWLSSCKLSGGSSGGPWMTKAVTGNGPVFSVNSWGYQGRPGMAGPRLGAGIPQCVYANSQSPRTPTNGGWKAACGS